MDISLPGKDEIKRHAGRARKVAIVGGGLSGTLACLQLLRCSPGVRITLFERAPRQLNRGVAYSARLSRQLLNVPAGRMGLFLDDPGGFLRWARSGPLPRATVDDFLPRSLFGDHVHDVFHTELEKDPGQVRIIAGEVIAIDHRPVYGYRVRLVDGSWSDHDAVILALGNAPPEHVPRLTPTAQKDPRYVAWPWQHGAMAEIDPDDRVLFVGAGLSMVDLLLSLEEHGHRGPVVVLSRRGLLPRAHTAPAKWAVDAPTLQNGQAEASTLLRWVRTEVEHAHSAGIPWQSVMDAVKSHVPSLWRSMPIAERQRFLRHLRPYWEVHRHRMPGPALEHIKAQMVSGRSRVIAGRIERIHSGGNGFTITYRARGEEGTQELRTDRLINCSGPQADTRRLEQPLLLDLLGKGMASWDPLHLGLLTTDEGALVDAAGQPSKGLFAIGPPCKASQWECTAVPEIREQAWALARLLDQVHRSRRKGFRGALLSLADHLAWPMA